MSIFRKIVFFGAFVFFLLSLIPNLLNYKNHLVFFQKIKEAYEKEKKKNIELKTKILRQKSVYELEKNIRNNLNLTRKNEMVVLLPPLKISPSPTPTPFLSNWQKWLKVFWE
ncbi:MAG: hypothetical protein NZL96_03640 [Patescibacteria group bacterium]|nr:hypothetical protein [Patescibacteria group bacterium]